MSEAFLFIAGHTALDFLNTEKGSSTGERVELLSTPASVAAWFEAAQLGSVSATEALFAEARALRDAIRALVVAWRNGQPAPVEPLTLFNRVLETGTARHFLTPEFAEGSVHVADDADPLLPVAHSALDLLTRHDKALVRQCAGTGCVLWFLDTTKNKRRRWCRMEVCGNREKVAAHYKRQHDDTNGT